MRGRKPAPTVLKLLRGNPGKRAVNHYEPKGDALSAEVPEELVDQEARDEWVRAIVPAIRIGQILIGDRALAIAHCEYWATWRSQVLEAAKHPHIIGVGPQKHPMPNPARSASHRTMYILKSIDAELGLTPVSRSRVVAGGPPSDDEERKQLARLLAIR